MPAARYLQEGRSLCLTQNKKLGPGSGKLFLHTARGMQLVSLKGIGNSSEMWELILKYVTERQLVTANIYSKIAILFTKQQCQNPLPFGLTFIKDLGSDKLIMKDG